MGSARGSRIGPGASPQADGESVSDLRRSREDFRGSYAQCRLIPMTGLDLLAKTGSRGLFIGGTWRESSSGSRFEVRDPADGSVITDVADGSTNDAIAALDAAAGVQAEWAATPPRERGEILRRSFEAITDQADDFAELMSLEMGKTVAEAQGRGDVRRGVLPVVLRGGRAHPRPLDAGAGRRQPAADDPQAGRPVPVHHAVELPAGHGHPQDRAGHRRRLHDGGQAGRADAADDAGPGRRPRRGRPARPASSTSSPPTTPRR